MEGLEVIEIKSMERVGGARANQGDSKEFLDVLQIVVA